MENTKEKSYMLALPEIEEELMDVSLLMNRMTSSQYFTVTGIQPDQNENPQITVVYKEKEYLVTVYPEDLQIPEMFRMQHIFRDIEVEKIEKREVGLIVEMDFSEDILDSYHLQLKIINTIFPKILGIIDYSSEKILSGRWAALAAQSKIPPAPRYIYTVQAVYDSDEDIWLHSHGLARCGIKELEVIHSTKASYQNHYSVLETVANRLIEDPEVLGDNHDTMYVARFSNQEGLIATWIPWQEYVEKVDDQWLGGKRDRVEDEKDGGGHCGYTGVLCVYRSEEDYNQGHYEPLSVYDELLEDNPMFMLTNAETNRMSALAKERIDYLKNALQSDAETALAKVGLLIDEEYRTETNNREHIWFELKEVNEENFTAVLTQEPYTVSGMHEGSVGTYPYDMITDWIIFKKDGRVTPDEVYLLA